MNNVSRVLAQTSIRIASPPHPSMLAARLSFTLCSRSAPSKHITKAGITLGRRILQLMPQSAKHEHSNTYSHLSTTVSSKLFWSLPSVHKSPSTIFPRNVENTPASKPTCSYQGPLQTLMFEDKVSLDCFENLLSPPTNSLICLCCIFMESAQKLAYMQVKLVTCLTTLFDHYHLLLSNYQCYIIWCLHFLCVPLCSHYLPFIGCYSAAQQQTN